MYFRIAFKTLLSLTHPQAATEEGKHALILGRPTFRFPLILSAGFLFLTPCSGQFTAYPLYVHVFCRDNL
jgi:hypothetical protein